MDDTTTLCRLDAKYLAPRIPADEAERLQALRQLSLLDTPTDERFDRIVRLTARFFDAPMATVSLVDKDRQWLKSRVGIGFTETPRQISFCTHTILQDRVLVVPDARLDMRFASSPLVVNDPYMRFYAGRPLRVNGFKVGSLCVLDHKPRSFGEREIELLDQLAVLIEHEMELVATIGWQNKALRVQEQLAESQRRLADTVTELEAAKVRGDDLLRHLLPANVADELQTRGAVEPVQHPDVAVMFADFTGFTLVASQITAAELVAELNECFCHFDWVSAKHGIEKLKTVGDAYICATGLNDPRPDDALRLTRAALEIRDHVAERLAKFTAQGKPYWDIRIGLHSGPLVSGIVGVRKFAYDIWGDTVNTAARIETASVPGRINASAAFLARVRDQVRSEPRGSIACKHKGDLEMAFIDALNP